MAGPGFLEQGVDQVGAHTESTPAGMDRDEDGSLFGEHRHTDELVVVLECAERDVGAGAEALVEAREEHLGPRRGDVSDARAGKGRSAQRGCCGRGAGPGTRRLHVEVHRVTAFLDCCSSIFRSAIIVKCRGVRRRYRRG